jgi:SsrA-binding protein
MTLIPLRLFFDENGRVKLDIGICKGKQLHDKRDTQKDRDWNREKQRLIRDKN